MRQTELLDALTPSHDDLPFVAPTIDPSGIGFHNATFSWANDSPSEASTPSSRNFKLRVEGELFFRKGKINIICGMRLISCLSRRRKSELIGFIRANWLRQK
jgi:hypothetical protein